MNKGGPGTSPDTARQPPIQVSAIKKPIRITDTDSALRWLNDRADIERMGPTRAAQDALKLDRMHELCALLNSPHHAFKSVHVAGTKGKGSTCEMTAACLEACGYAVGIYTSPHLLDIRERIRINRTQISEAQFVRVAIRVQEAASRLAPESGEPTFFELLTAMAFAHFAEEAVDVAVIEVGLGGRLDSTNIITPEVTAITNISRDHWQILGDTLEKIAKEKAGIFKSGVPAITVQQTPGVLQTLKDAAARAGTRLEVVGEDIEFSHRFEANHTHGPHMLVGLATDRTSFEHISVPLMGEHQAFNCGLALAILDRLGERGFRITDARITKGLASVRMPGRMEIVRENPRVLLDGAHNAESIKALIRAIGTQVPYDSMIVIFGCAADKDIPGMLAEIALGADKVIFTRTRGSARAADPQELARRFTEENERMAQTAASLEEALALAGRGVGRDDLICITGSLHLVGEAKGLMLKSAKS